MQTPQIRPVCVADSFARSFHFVQAKQKHNPSLSSSYSYRVKLDHALAPVLAKKKSITRPPFTVNQPYGYNAISVMINSINTPPMLASVWHNLCPKKPVITRRLLLFPCSNPSFPLQPPPPSPHRQRQRRHRDSPSSSPARRRPHPSRLFRRASPAPVQRERL